MLETLAPLIQWMEQWLLAVNPGSLFFLSFIESIFFPIPPDALLLPLSVLRPHMAPLFGLLATAGSVCGAVVGYAIGKWGGRPVLQRFTSPERMQQVETLFQRYDAWAIAIGGFTPLPYKVFSLAAGVFRLSLPRFIIVSFLSRGARFMLEAFLVMLYGEPVVEFIRQHFGWLTLLLFALFALAYFTFTAWRRRRPSHP